MGKLVPKEHQKRVTTKLQEHPGQLLYWDLGSGKTFGAINAANDLHAKTTVITPASLQKNFLKEINNTNSNASNFDIKSYDKFVRDPEIKNTDLLILDEAHRIKNSDTKRSKELLAVAHKFNKRLLLTGTPIQDKPSDMSPLINMISGENTLPTDPKTFNKTFIQTNTIYPSIIDRLFKGKKPVKQIKLKNQKLLESKIHGLIDYYSSKNPDFYPEVSEYNVNVPMTKEQIDSYNYVEKTLPRLLRRKINSFSTLTGKESKQLNAFLSATRQISNSNAMFGDEEVTPKIETIVDRIKETNGPSLVYSNYLNSGVYPVAHELHKDKIPFGLFTGELSPTQKQQLVNDYNAGKLKALLVSSSGGEGLDLKRTRAVHIMEPHWNNPKLEQVIGRAIRYKSHTMLPKEQQNVNIYKYVSVFPEKTTLLNRLGLSSEKRKRVTADEYLYNMSSNKEKINNLFLNLLKQEGQNNG